MLAAETGPADGDSVGGIRVTQLLRAFKASQGIAHPVEIAQARAFVDPRIRISRIGLEDAVAAAAGSTEDLVDVPAILNARAAPELGRHRSPCLVRPATT